MTRRRGTIAVLVTVLAMLSGCFGCIDQLVGNTVSLTPPGPLSVPVGESVTVTANVRPIFIREGYRSDAGTTTWASSDSSVATVDGQGKITCLRSGAVTVTVINTNNAATTTSTISVTCVAPPPALDIAVTPPQVPFNHTVGTTSCPQKIGSLHITSNQQVNVSVVPANSAITVASPTLTVPAAGAADVDVFFNCTVTASFTTTIVVTATNAAGGTATRTVTVVATIAR